METGERLPPLLQAKTILNMVMSSGGDFQKLLDLQRLQNARKRDTYDLRILCFIEKFAFTGHEQNFVQMYPSLAAKAYKSLPFI